MVSKITVSDLIEAIGEEWGTLGSWDRYVTKVAPLNEADSNCLAFCEKLDADLINNSKAGVIICPPETEFMDVDFETKTLIQVENPRRAFVRLVKKYFIPEEEDGKYIEGAFIYPNARIGKNVIISPGAVIGKTSIGFFAGDNDDLVKFPQIGGVVIGDDVEIGSCVVVDRGALSDTIIGEGTKIDNLVHIAHNVKIGKHCALIAHAFVGGSATIGDYSWIGPHAAIRDWVNVGKRVIVGIGAVVTKDIPDDAIVIGVPAKQIGENIPFRRIP